MRKTLPLLIGSATLVAASTLTAGAASASTTPGTPRVLTGGLISPLSIDVRGNGTVYVAQNFAGLLTKVKKNGTSKVIASTEGDELGAVSHFGSVVYYATTVQGGPEAPPENPGAKLWRLKNGKSTAIADLYAYEKTKNPDGAKKYGFVNLPETCAAQFPEENPATYTGIVDSHPYATVTTKRNVYVADAAANAILKVNRKTHKIKTVAVLPAAPAINITAEIAEAQGLPSCAAGYSYRFESVPTDLEIGAGGKFYVSSLPGGPEDPSLGARGAIYTVKPSTGKATRIAGGFVGTTGLAVAKDGTIYVAELFGGKTGSGRVSVVRPGSGSPKKFITVASPAAIELLGNKLYVSTDALSDPPGGEITIIPLKKK
ncbi:ScyD/ScyE family protein [soil metagenome]